MAQLIKRDLMVLVANAGLTVEGNETVDELAEALGYLVMRRPTMLTTGIAEVLVEDALADGGDAA